MNAYLYDPNTKEFLCETTTEPDPLESRAQGRDIYLVPGNGTLTAPPDIPAGRAAVWNGAAWDLVEDHRQKRDAGGVPVEGSGTPYWLPAEGDDWSSSPRYMKMPGPLPEGAVTERPEKPAPTLEDVRADAVKNVDAATSAAILAGFNYEIDPGAGAPESLHFSYDSFDQQNFADSANVALLSLSNPQAKGDLPASVTWNAYRNHTPDTGGELVRLTLDAAGFLALYTGGALAHKAAKMEEGGQRKAAVEAAESVEAVRALLAEWGL